MIDLLHNYNRLGYEFKDIKKHLKDYVAEITTISGINHFQLALNAIDIEATGVSLSDVIYHVKNFIVNNFFKNDLILSDGTRYVNKSVGEISKQLSSLYVQTGDTSFSAKKYMYMYIKWFYHSIDDIIACLLNNSSINDIDLVGPRTKEYLDEVGLSKVEKRFGTPNKRTAVPLSFNYGHFIVGPPPITINTWGKETIDSVYRALNYPIVEYIHTRKKWTFARPSLKDKSMSTYFPVNALMRLNANVRNSSDLLASMAYDYFLLYCMDRFSNLDVSVVNINLGVDEMITNGVSANVDAEPFLKEMRYYDNTVNVIGMLNLIY